MPAAGQAVGQAGPLADPTPPPGAVVESGLTPVAVHGAGPVQLEVDGAPVATGHDSAGRWTSTVDLDPGAHTIRAVTGEGERSWHLVASGLAVQRVAGADRYATAVAVSGARGLLARPDAVVVARSDVGVDALTAAPLAVVLDAPLLLVDSQRLPPATADALPDGATVHVVGGEAAVADEVLDDLRDAGHEVVRHAGRDRFATAAAVAHAVREAGGTGGVVVTAAATGQSAAGLASARGWPLLLAEPATLPGATAEWLDDHPETPVTAIATSAVDQVAESHADAVAAANAVPSPAVAIADPADALTAASLGVPIVTPEDTRAVHGRSELIVVGGPAAIGADRVATWHREAVSGLQAPQVTSQVEGDLEVLLTADRPVDAASVHVTLAGREVPGTTHVQGTDVRWTATELPPAAPRGSPTALAVTAVVASHGAGRHVAAEERVTLPPVGTAPGGFQVLAAASAVVGSGPLSTFTVEVEPATGVDPTLFGLTATGLLLDPRGWTGAGERSLQRVADPAAADFRVVLATPATVDRYCSAVGLGTGGTLSCWDGRRALLNLDRWLQGTAFHPDLRVYRAYLVNHESGHALGYRHVGCPAAGALAPVMMQQTKGLGGCLPNGWAYPVAPGEGG